MASEHIINVGDADFQNQVISSENPVLVDFWATWCGPCRALAPILEDLSNEYVGRVKIAKVDVDSNQSTAAQFGVRSIPTLLLFKDGQVISNRAGAAPKAALQSWIDESI